MSKIEIERTYGTLFFARYPGRRYDGSGMAAGKDVGRRYGRKISSLGVFFCTLFLGCSLLSAFGIGSDWCGIAGVFIGRGLHSFLGYAACWLLLVFLALAFSLYSSSFSPFSFARFFITSTISVLSLSLLLAQLGEFAAVVGCGGFVGVTMLAWLRPLLGVVGVLLVGLFLFFWMLFLLPNFHFLSEFIHFGSWFRTFFSKFPSIGGWRACFRTKSSKTFVRETAIEPKLRSVEKSVLGSGDWRLPPFSLLALDKDVQDSGDNVAAELEAQLAHFGVSGAVIGVVPGPVVTTYQYAPAPGVKMSRIISLAGDIALGLRVASLRVAGSVPGKAALGIEIPNAKRHSVGLRNLLESKQFQEGGDPLRVVLGRDVVGKPALATLASMPHLLIAGATGAGKSVCINAILASILYRATPDQVRLLLIDPKRIELSGYEGIPHLLHPVVVDPRQAAAALAWAVAEMERRYQLLEEAGAKSFATYNKKSSSPLPYIVIVVDELADLMMVAAKDVEVSVARLAQMARAAGIHMVLATQRPSVDVLTGLIKANFPARISFKVASKIDSRTILDAVGAEHLLGLGDMLFLAPGSAALRRIHGAYISEEETADIVKFLKEQASSSYDESVVQAVASQQNQGKSEKNSSPLDPRYDEAVEVVTLSGQASISFVQRQLRIGYNRAARIVESMEQEGVIGPSLGAKGREVYAKSDYD